MVYTKVSKGLTLSRVIDHPEIAMSDEEYNRIMNNKAYYQSPSQIVGEYGIDGRWCERETHVINVTKVVARKLAKLVFNEGVSLNLGDDTAQEFVDGVFDHNRFEKVFGEELEAGYAVSGVAIRPIYDSVSNEIKFTYFTADNFFPLVGSINVVDEAALRSIYYTVEYDRPVWYTLLEFHRKTPSGYVIINQLFRSENKMMVGEQVTLDSCVETENLEEVVVLNDFTHPLFVYIKLAGKNNHEYRSPLGLGVVDNARQQLLDINDKYDMFMEEIANAQRRIMASDEFFKMQVDPITGRLEKNYDPRTTVFQKLKGDEPILQDFTPQLRSQEFIDSINFILKIIEVQVGLSAGTFSFDGKSMKTATEIVSENTETYQTRSDNVLILEEALSELAIICLELGSALGIYSGNIEPDIDVDFDDGVFTDKNDKMAYNTNALNAGILSKRTAMMNQFGWTLEQAEEEFALIVEETQRNDPIFGQVEAERSLFGSSEAGVQNTIDENMDV